MTGAILLVLAMLVVLPALLFAAGAAWSALVGQVLTAEAGARAAPAPPDGG